mgnify:CR=1 FL=1
MKITAKDILKPALILFVICLVVTALLAGTNLLTKDKIAEQSALEAEQSRKVVLSDADSFEEADGYYIGKANNETVGYVFQTEAKGYGGAVKVMTGIIRPESAWARNPLFRSLSLSRQNSSLAFSSPL